MEDVHVFGFKRSIVSKSVQFILEGAQLYVKIENPSVLRYLGSLLIGGEAFGDLRLQSLDYVYTRALAAGP